MYTLLKPLHVRDELLQRGIRFFTQELFTRVFQSSPHATKYFLETQTKEGLLLRLKKGLYTFRTDRPSEEEIANVLYQPSYISFEYALAYYGILPEMVYTVTSATTKPTRLFTVGTLAYSYRTIKKPAFTGYMLVRKENRSFFIAEPEKALVDYLYFVSLGSSTLNDRLALRWNTRSKGEYGTLHKDRVKQYAKLFNRMQLEQLMGGLL